MRSQFSEWGLAFGAWALGRCFHSLLASSLQKYLASWKNSLTSVRKKGKQMKIRSDYVSNSSSSSFMVVGKSFDFDELVEIAKHNKLTSEYHEVPEGEEPDYENWDSYDIVSGLEEKFGDLEFNSGLESYYDCYCVGMGYGAMAKDETRAQFEERIAKRLSEMTGKEITSVSCMVDGGRDD